MISKKVFKIVQNCVPVCGAHQSLICDLHRKTYHIIPNDLYVILNEHEDKTIQEVKDVYNNKYDAIIDEYFEFLLKKEYIFFTNTPNWFPKMNMQFYEPFEISNAIIDRGEHSKYDIYDVLDQLESLKCKYIEIRFFNAVVFREIEKILVYLSTKEHIVNSVGFLLPFSEAFRQKQHELPARFPRLSYMIFHDAKQNKFMSPVNNDSGYIIYTKHKMTDEKCCGVINKSYFVSNIPSFTESLKHNSCLNRKISIDSHGNIRNCPSMPQSFGNIKDTTLEEALSHKDFKKYWNMTKDQIEVCKDCEFRYICTDCRAYLDNPEDKYSKPLKCGYDPYTNTWEDWSANPLKQKAIAVYGMQDLV